MKDKSIVILAGGKKTTTILYNSLKDDFDIKEVVIEKQVSRIAFLKKRARNLGILKVLGQILFKLIMVPYLKRASRTRIREIKRCFGLSDTPIDRHKITNVTSVNSDKTMDILRKLNPDIVVINGTRIIKSNILDCIPARFINIHAGITPLYRGVHGAYWALVERRKVVCGVTVHFVDTGIDTGSILEQGVIEPTRKDNFLTYPLLQLATGLPLLKKSIRGIFANNIETKPPPVGTSKLWSHPTLWEYLWYRTRYGIK